MKSVKSSLIILCLLSYQTHLTICSGKSLNPVRYDSPVSVNSNKSSCSYTYSLSPIRNRESQYTPLSDGSSEYTALSDDNNDITMNETNNYQKSIRKLLVCCCCCWNKKQ